mgnify:CR=1 FL=1
MMTLVTKELPFGSKIDEITIQGILGNKCIQQTIFLFPYYVQLW